jgi:hypothetical protein
MEDTKKTLEKRLEDHKNDATQPFANVENDNAVEINHAGDEDSRKYMGKKDEKKGGPNWDKVSKEEDGDTGSNAGIFK